MPQSVECPTPDFSSGHDLAVCWVGALHQAIRWPCWGSLSPSLSVPTPALMCGRSRSLCLKNKLKKKKYFLFVPILVYVLPKQALEYFLL